MRPWMSLVLSLLLVSSLVWPTEADSEGCEAECERKFPGKANFVCNSARGTTYPNRCSAEICAQVRVDCETACPCKRVCPECDNEERNESTMRCASGNIQYNNDCEVRCNNAAVECQGRCPCWGGP